MFMMAQIAWQRESYAHELLCLIRYYLDFHIHDFGSAFDSILLIVYLRFSDDAARDDPFRQKSNSSIREKEKPQIRINSIKRRILVVYVSNASTAEIEFGSQSSDAHTFSEFCAEFIDVMLGLRKKLKKVDDFKIEEFENLLRKKRAELPIDQERLDMLRKLNEQFPNYRSPKEQTNTDLPRNPEIPKRIPIKRTDSHTDTIGKFLGGYFWGHVVQGYGTTESGFVASKYLYSVLHKFDFNGTYVESLSKKTERSAKCSWEEAAEQLNGMLQTLENYSFEDIQIDLFAVYIDGMLFGLVDESYDEGETIVTMKPDDLQFVPPWDGHFGT